MFGIMCVARNVDILLIQSNSYYKIAEHSEGFLLLFLEEYVIF